MKAPFTKYLYLLLKSVPYRQHSIGFLSVMGENREFRLSTTHTNTRTH
jgi:hypothetical protein